MSRTVKKKEPGIKVRLPYQRTSIAHKNRKKHQKVNQKHKKQPHNDE